MATDRDEQVRQQQELEEIRRSFAEMGARMGSLFEPTEADQPVLPAPPPATPAPAPAPTPTPARPRWWAVAAPALVFAAGGVFGFLLPRGQSDDPNSSSPSVTTQARAATPPPPRTFTKTSVPEACLETAEKGDEVIAHLTANIRNNRLSLALRDYTIASQACRREASP
jgi:hypothetical protein